MKDLPSGVSSPSHMLSEQAGNILKDEEYHRPTPQEIASYAGGAPSSD